MLFTHLLSFPTVDAYDVLVCGGIVSIPSSHLLVEAFVIARFALGVLKTSYLSLLDFLGFVGSKDSSTHLFVTSCLVMHDTGF